LRLWNSEGVQQTIEFVSFSFDAFLAVAGVLFALVVVASRDAVTLLASSRYRGADTLIPTLVAGLLIYTMQIFLNAGLVIQKRTGMMALVLCCSAVLNVVLNVLLLSRIGMQGAAFATLLSYLICTLLLSLQSFRVLPLKINCRRVLGYAAATAAAIGVSRLIQLEVPVWNLALRCAVVLGTYGGLMYLLDARIRGLAGQIIARSTSSGLEAERVA
jgi:O-antigen/teichoic acid export membrane protein